jgi:hypothetical protein
MGKKSAEGQTKLNIFRKTHQFFDQYKQYAFLIKHTVHLNKGLYLTPLA